MTVKKNLESIAKDKADINGSIIIWHQLTKEKREEILKVISNKK